MQKLVIAAAAGLLASCGGADQETQAEQRPTALTAGEYELAWSDLKVTPKGNGGTAADSDVSAVLPTRTCVAEGSQIEPAAFAEEGDDCKFVNSYVRNGIFNVQVSCKREGKGKLAHVGNGKFTADSFEADIESETNFDQADNYRMTGKLTGRRIGACTAGA